MLRFIESVSYENGVMPLIELHQERFAQTQMAAFGKIIFDDLSVIISNNTKYFSLQNDVKYKSRIVYDAENYEVSFHPHSKKVIKRLKIKIDNTIDYAYKYENRVQINYLTQNLDSDTDIIILKNNLLTDASIANIALFDGVRWYTPSKPLLRGVQRKNLLLQKKIHPRDISIADLRNFSKIRLFNAMVSWDEAWELDTKDISL